MASLDSDIIIRPSRISIVTVKQEPDGTYSKTCLTKEVNGGNCQNFDGRYSSYHIHIHPKEHVIDEINDVGDGSASFNQSFTCTSERYKRMPTRKKSIVRRYGSRILRMTNPRHFPSTKVYRNFNTKITKLNFERNQSKIPKIGDADVNFLSENNSIMGKRPLNHHVNTDNTKTRKSLNELMSNDKIQAENEVGESQNLNLVSTNPNTKQNRHSNIKKHLKVTPSLRQEKTVKKIKTSTTSALKMYKREDKIIKQTDPRVKLKTSKGTLRYTTSTVSYRNKNNMPVKATINKKQIYIEENYLFASYMQKADLKRKISNFSKVVKKETRKAIPKKGTGSLQKPTAIISNPHPKHIISTNMKPIEISTSMKWKQNSPNPYEKQLRQSSKVSKKSPLPYRGKLNHERENTPKIRQKAKQTESVRNSSQTSLICKTASEHSFRKIKAKEIKDANKTIQQIRTLQKRHTDNYSPSKKPASRKENESQIHKTENKIIGLKKSRSCSDVRFRPDLIKTESTISNGFRMNEINSTKPRRESKSSRNGYTLLRERNNKTSHNSFPSPHISTKYQRDHRSPDTKFLGVIDSLTLPTTTGSTAKKTNENDMFSSDGSKRYRNRFKTSGKDKDTQRKKCQSRKMFKENYYSNQNNENVMLTPSSTVYDKRYLPGHSYLKYNSTEDILRQIKRIQQKLILTEDDYKEDMSSFIIKTKYRSNYFKRISNLRKPSLSTINESSEILSTATE